MSAVMYQTNTHFIQTPLSPISNCDDKELDMNHYNIENDNTYEDIYDDDLDLSAFTEREVDYLKSFFGSDMDEEELVVVNQDNLLRDQFNSIIKNGLIINNEKVSYTDVIQQLHAYGNMNYNEKTEDSILLRVYENGNKNYFEDFWVHPIYLTLQSFKFFKHFGYINYAYGEEQQQNIIEFNVPSLKTFSVVLKLLYTGNYKEIYGIAKINKSFYYDIIENIKYLEISMPNISY